MKNKKFLIGIIIFLSALLLSIFLIIREPFATEEDDLRKEINTVITIFNDTICPANKIVIDDYKVELEGSESEKLTAATEKLKMEAGGTVFPCPPPDNPLQLPADIDKQIQRSLDFFSKRLKTMKDTLQQTLGSCNSKVSIPEGFEDTVNICPPPLGKSQSPPPQATKQDCISVHEISAESVIPILKARAQVLSNLIKDQKVAETVASIQADTAELLTLKKRAESGELRPSCPL
jgi:hypothetical protein